MCIQSGYDGWGYGTSVGRLSKVGIHVGKEGGGDSCINVFLYG